MENKGNWKYNLLVLLISDQDINVHFESSVTTLVFRRFPVLMDSMLHTIQLLPLYTPGE
jgi:hypothetical protein